MSEPKVAYRDTWPADVSIRADAELGRAWRRCEAANPAGSQMGVMKGRPYYAWSYDGGEETIEGEGDTATAALNALADELEKRAAE